MSNFRRQRLHLPEETVMLDFGLTVKPVLGVDDHSPIEDYFEVTEKLKHIYLPTLRK